MIFFSNQLFGPVILASELPIGHLPNPRQRFSNRMPARRLFELLRPCAEKIAPAIPVALHFFPPNFVLDRKKLTLASM